MAGTPIGNLVVKMSTDESQLTRGINRAQKHLKRLDRSVRGAGSGINALVASYVGFRTIVTATNALMEGAALEREENRMNAFAGSVEKGAESLAAFNRGAGDTADRLTAVQQTSRIMQLGLAGNAQELENLVEMATRLGKQTLSVTQRVEDFTALLANQSTRRLDNFGISAAQVTNRVAELKEEFPNVAKETLWLRAAIEGGMESLGKLGERSGDTLSKFEKLRAKISDLRLEIAKGIAPAVASGADSLIGQLADMDPSGKGSATSGIAAVTDSILSFADGVITAFKVITNGVQAYAATVWEFGSSLVQFAVEAVRGLIIGLGLEDSDSAVIRGFNSMKESVDSFNQGLGIIKEEKLAKVEELLKAFEHRRAGGPKLPEDVPPQEAARARTWWDKATAAIQKFDTYIGMQTGPGRDDIRSLILERGEALTSQIAANQALIDKAEAALKQPAQIFAEAQVSGSAGYLSATLGLNTQNRERQAEIARQKQQLEELKKINETLKKSLEDNTERTMEIAY
jgi:hypothetical protein